MRAIFSETEKIDEGLSRQIDEGFKDPLNLKVTGFNPRTTHWYEGTHEGFIRFLMQDVMG